MLQELYAQFIQTNHLKIDRHQLTLIDKLQSYINFLPRRFTMSGALVSLLKRYPKLPDGIYIYGGVGRGKSMVSNLFYRYVDIPYKKRFHFHKFMLEVHQTLQHIMDKKPDLSSRLLMQEVVRTVLSHCTLLYLDELQINNIADAMLIERLFKAFKHFNIFVLVTSNRQPNDLFSDDINRDRLIPFIKNIESHFDVFSLDGNLDYRSEKASHLSQTYFYPLNEGTNENMMHEVGQITHLNKLHEMTIKVEDGRTLKVMSAYGNTVVFNFSELCDIPLGAADYMAICHHFKNIVIKNIPQLFADDHNQALRFITLIDCIYESKARLICSAATEVDMIYNGTKNKFEFARTISRLKEMQKTEYLSQSDKCIMAVE